jgi:non-ribosomal peptide synthetase-like protein
MTGPALAAVFLVFVGLTFVAWRRYLWVARQGRLKQEDTCPYSLTDVFGSRHLQNVPHQDGVRWLTEIFSRSAARFPDHTALQIPHTGESLTFAELDARAEAVAAALAPLLTGPDQVVAVAMAQDNWQIVASHLGILKAGGTVMFLDTTLPDALVTHMLDDAQPVVVLTRGQDGFRGLPTLDVLALPEAKPRSAPPPWMDDPRERLASIFYTSGTTGMPKGVECPHAGYVNLALSYADYFGLVPGMDATSLTSSLGYDGSISEMYSAWVSGCAVVLLTKEQIRSGPDLVPVLREAEVTVLFCPPVLLTTLTAAPELDLPYPICRYVVPAGEAFPPAFVEPWTRGRRQIINTYGPTEASTDTSRQSLRPGEPVTIGPPFPNVTYVILEVGGLRPQPHGEAGELCIGGVHLARGYRNLPEETARKFITHPRFGRLYRTGDKCRIDIRTQRVHFLGRIDAQLKVRGHRVEIEPVEDLLRTQFREIEAAVLDYQNQELVAFVAAPSLCEGEITVVAPAPAEWATRVTESLARRLPAPSVPTRIFLVGEFVLNPVSGKIDRKCLPDLSQLRANAASQAEESSGGSPKRTQMEEPRAGTPPDIDADAKPACDEVLAICREMFDNTGLGCDDVFADNGGHSILIAELALRLQVAGWKVTVRDLLTDCNTARRVAALPRALREASESPAAAVQADRSRSERDEAAAEVLSISHFTTLQALFLLLLYFPHMMGFLGLVAVLRIGELFLGAHLRGFILLGFLMYSSALLLPFWNVLWVTVIRLFPGGDIHRSIVRPGVYPKWSRVHLRTWCVEQMAQSVLWPLRTMVRSAPLMAWALRRLGATVGDNLQCDHDVEFFGPLDLLSIGDDVAIQTGAYISMSRWVGQELHVGPVHLESGCKIGMRAGVANGVTVGRGSWITPLTPVLSDVGPEEMWQGAPARFVGRCTELKRTASSCRHVFPFRLLEALNILMQVVLEFCLLVLPAATASWWAADFVFGGEAERAGRYFEGTPLPVIVWQLGLYAFITTCVTIVLISVLGCVFLRFTSASPGLYPTRGLRGALLLYRVRKLNQIQRMWTWTLTGQYLRALAGVGFPRVGASECDLMTNLVPELVAAGSQAFWSHGCFTNVLDHGARYLKLCQLDMPENFFASNNCVAESGQLPSNFLLGVSTPGNDIQFRRQMRSRLGVPMTVAGNPPVKFGSADFEAENRAQELPRFPLFLGRVALNDIFSIGLLPIADVLAYAVFYTILLRSFGHPLLSGLAALISAEGFLVCSPALVKKVLVGSTWGSDHSTSFWSWRHFTYFFAQDCFLAWCRRPLRILTGTLLANPILRRMGCRIGRRTILIGPLQAFDWNAVSFGDDCVVAGLLQFHSFENMTLKVKRTEIRDGSSVNFGTTIMGGAVIEPGTTLLPLSLVLKGMHLPTATYEGSPAEPLGGARHSFGFTTEPLPGAGHSELSGEVARASSCSRGAAAAT